VTRARFAITFGLAAVLVWLQQARAQPARYELDPEHVTVGFLVEHVGYAKVLGRFADVEGSYRFDERTGELSDLRVEVATTSVSTDHGERDEHLASADFLSSDRFPRMVFTAATARRTGERTFEVRGELQLLGRTLPLTLDATWNKSGAYPFGGSAYVMGVSAHGSLRRSAYGMTYGVDNGWVGDEVEIIIELEARKR
jgi:polyisoprenoid-binding protein YceI